MVIIGQGYHIIRQGYHKEGADYKARTGLGSAVVRLYNYWTEVCVLITLLHNEVLAELHKLMRCMQTSQYYVCRGQLGRDTQRTLITKRLSQTFPECFILELLICLTKVKVRHFHRQSGTETVLHPY